MKKLFTAAAAFILAMGASQAALAKQEMPQVTEHGLVLEERGTFQHTWVHPDADFSKYDKIVLIDGELEFRDVGPARKSRSRALYSNEREFGVSEKDQARFSDRVEKAFTKSLAKSDHYEIVEQRGPSTLILRGHVVDVVSHVPPPLAGRGEVYSASMGEVTMILEVYDGETGKPLALATERRALQRPGGQYIDTMSSANSVTAWAEVNRWASRTGSRVANALDSSHEL